MYSRILVALDGSACSLAAGRLARSLARGLDAELIACHIYGAQLHNERFQEMEPDLPEPYQTPQRLGELRKAHDSLISEGFQSLSLGYMEEFIRETRESGLTVHEMSREGRNYVRLLECAAEIKASLLILGSWGLGSVGDGSLGTTAARILRKAPMDVLIARGDSLGNCIMAGIDGSPDALRAAEKAAELARGADLPLNLAAAFDLDLHREVFKTLTHAISAERQAEVGLSRQEVLHETFIDDGLKLLYQRFLEDAARHLREQGISAKTTVLCGKAGRALSDHAREMKAGLVVLGRFGHHREAISDLGSVAEAVARQGTNPSVLITTSVNADLETTGAAIRRNTGQVTSPIPDRSATPFVGPLRNPTPAAELPWDDEALERLERIPVFAQPMARAGIERFVRTQGGDRVTLAAFLEVARSMGMGDSDGRDS